jgi:hypothetical protein
MPLYNIKEVNFNNIPLIDQSHLRVMWTYLIRNANMFFMENQVNPRIYVGTEAFKIINQSTSFSFRDINSGPIDYVGHFMGWNVFISDELVKDEYVLGIDENEIKICKRKYKLKKIVEKMTK